LEAIRQNRDYKVPKRCRKLRPSLFGLPGTLAKSYYRISKGKYRATLISLIISLVLFLSAAGFTAGLKTTADSAINLENFDFDHYGSYEEAQELRVQEFVDRSAYTTHGYFLSHITEDQRSARFLEYKEDLTRFYPQATDPVGDIQVYYLEDEILRDYLLSHDLDPEAYLDSTAPKALVCHKEVTTYYMADENGLYNRYTYRYPPSPRMPGSWCCSPTGVLKSSFPPMRWSNGPTAMAQMKQAA
jgi:putative ABC transport system permease protein